MTGTFVADLNGIMHPNEVLLFAEVGAYKPLTATRSIIVNRQRVEFTGAGLDIGIRYDFPIRVRTARLDGLPGCDRLVICRCGIGIDDRFGGQTITHNASCRRAGAGWHPPEKISNTLVRA